MITASLTSDLTTVEEVNCDTCHTQGTSCQEQKKISLIPAKCAVVTINMSDVSELSSDKNKSIVNVGRIITLSTIPLSITILTNNYQLKSILLHDGETTSTGHYTVVLKIDHTFTICNDEEVGRSWKSLKSIEDHCYNETTASPYMLFYEKD